VLIAGVPGEGRLAARPIPKHRERRRLIDAISYQQVAYQCEQYTRQAERNLDIRTLADAQFRTSDDAYIAANHAIAAA